MSGDRGTASMADLYQILTKSMTGLRQSRFKIAVEVRTMTRGLWIRWMVALLMAVPVAAQKPEAAETMMQAAGKKEVVDGDLSGAIKQYAAIVSRYAKSDRAITAKALVRMA